MISVRTRKRKIQGKFVHQGINEHSGFISAGFPEHSIYIQIENVTAKHLYKSSGVGLTPINSRQIMFLLGMYGEEAITLAR